MLRGQATDFSGGLGHEFCVCLEPKSPMESGFYTDAHTAVLVVRIQLLGLWEI